MAKNLFLSIVQAVTEVLKNPVSVCKWEIAPFPLRSILGKSHSKKCPWLSQASKNNIFLDDLHIFRLNHTSYLRKIGIMSSPVEAANDSIKAFSRFLSSSETGSAFTAHWKIKRKCFWFWNTPRPDRFE